MGWFSPDTINVKYSQGFKDFLKKYDMKLRDEKSADYITWAIYALWQEIQATKGTK